MRDIHITTLSSAVTLPDGRCDDRRTCPAVHTVADRPDVYYVVTTQVTDEDERAAFAELIGPGETLGTMPRAVLDQLAERLRA